ncbi:uridine kinase [bacterium]|nr:uridine kinase [bacterium]
MPQLILIAGGSSSGKTTISTMLNQGLSEISVSLISMDNYYRDVSSLNKDELRKYNFDHPGAIDGQLLVQNVEEAMQSRKVSIPGYDFITHKRIDSETAVHPSEVIVVEGIFALFFEQLVRKADLKIFIDVEPDTRLIRRIRRDISERGFAIDEVLGAYEKTVKPMFEAFVEPTKKHADVIIPGNKLFSTPLDMINGYLTKKVIDKIRSHQKFD